MLRDGIHKASGSTPPGTTDSLIGFFLRKGLTIREVSGYQRIEVKAT